MLNHITVDSRRGLVGGKTHLHTPTAVTYHEQLYYCRCMIGHSLGRMESRCRAIFILLIMCVRLATGGRGTSVGAGVEHDELSVRPVGDRVIGAWC